MVLENVKGKINDVMSETKIKDTVLKKKIKILMNNICLQKLDKNTYVFFIHFASKKKGVIYQLILSGDSFDGIYEFEVFGHDVSFTNVINELGPAFKIRTTSNYDLAAFDVKDVVTTITKENNIQFKAELNTILSKLSNYNEVDLEIKDVAEEKNLKKALLGEVKFRATLKKEINKHFDNLCEVRFLEKRKIHFISKIDLGETEFKKQLINLGLVTEKEYDLYTNFNDKLYAELKNNFKNVEIIE